MFTTHSDRAARGDSELRERFIARLILLFTWAPLPIAVALFVGGLLLENDTMMRRSGIVAAFTPLTWLARTYITKARYLLGPAVLAVFGSVLLRTDHNAALLGTLALFFIGTLMLVVLRTDQRWPIYAYGVILALFQVVARPDEPVIEILIGVAGVVGLWALHGLPIHFLLTEHRRALTAKDQILTTVSHELRGPLTTILGLAELDAAEGSETASLAAREARHMHTLLEDLIVAFRPGAAPVIEVSPVRVLDAINSELCEECVTGGADVMAMADPLRLRQVLANLTQNAHRYGGPRRGFFVHVEDDRVLIDAFDNGSGISGTSEEVFEPFYTDRTHRDSLGIGLTVSRGLARLMGGDLIYLREGDETIFRLSLPLAPDTDSA